MSKPAYGQIIYATVPDPNGVNHKQRPLVIVTDDAEIVADQPFVAIAISTNYSHTST